MLVIAAAQRLGRFLLQGLLDDQLRGQSDQLRSFGRRFPPPFHQRFQLLACPLGCRYSLHRGAPSFEVSFPNQASPDSPNQARDHPNRFSSKFRTSPAARVIDWMKCVEISRRSSRRRADRRDNWAKGQWTPCSSRVTVGAGFLCRWNVPAYALPPTACCSHRTDCDCGGRHQFGWSRNRR